MEAIARHGPVWAVIFSFIIGCSYSSERMHPIYTDCMRNIRTVLILPPEIAVVRQMYDGSIVRCDEDSRSARTEIMAAMRQGLAAKRLQVQVADGKMPPLQEVENLQALFRAVHHSIQLHTQGPQKFPSKMRSFDYELGPVAELLKESGVDAIVLALGLQAVSLDQSSVWISIAVVEPQGRVIWYNSVAERGILGIQHLHEAQSLINRLLSGFGEVS